MMRGYVVFLLSLSMFGFTANAQPTIEANGDDLQLNAGPDGQITFVVPGQNPPVETTVAFLLNSIMDLNKLVADLQAEVKELKANDGADAMVDLKADVEDLKDSMSLAQKNVTGLQEDLKEEMDIRQESIDSTVDMVNKETETLQTAVSANTKATVDLTETVQTDVESLDNDIGVLGKKVDKILSDGGGDGTPTFITCPKMSIANSLLHPSVAKIEHIVGFSVTIKCKDGYFVDAVSAQVTCFAEGEYCASENFGVKSCDKSQLPKCTKCADGCTSCISKDGGCSECEKGSYLLNKKCVVTKDATSCKKLYDLGVLKDEKTDVQLTTPKNGKVVDAICLVAGGQAHTHIKCDQLNNGRTCPSHAIIAQETLCKSYGLYVTPFRNRKHWDAAFNSLGTRVLEQYYRTVGGVIGAKNGVSYTNCSPFVSTNGCYKGDWKSVDDKEWFIYSERYGEPNGDYTPGCYLQRRQITAEGMTPNDENCDHATGPYYMCGTSEY